MTTNRVEKINSLLKHEIGNILLKEFYFPDAMVTLTRVQTSSNLIETKIFISVYPEIKLDHAVKSLNNNVYDIQQKINKILKMRPVPKIKFVKDTDSARAGKIEELLGRLKKDER